MNQMQMGLRAQFRVHDGTTLQHVIDALGDFGKHFGCYKSEDCVTVPETGALPQDEMSIDEVRLSNDRELTLRLEYWEVLDEQHPRMIDKMLSALGNMVVSSAAVELLLLGETGDPDDSKVVGAKFIGATELARCKARLAYGVEQARPWLEPILGSREFATVERQVLEYASSTQVLANSLLAS